MENIPRMLIFGISEGSISKRSDFYDG